MIHYYTVERRGWLGGWTQPSISVKTRAEAEGLFNEYASRMNDWLPPDISGEVIRMIEWKSDRIPKRAVLRTRKTAGYGTEQDLF